MKIYDLIETMTREHKTIFDMPLRVTFYARVSTKKDVQLNSQENQVQTFTEMISNNSHWTLVNGYIDTIRGENAANRDNFIRMIEDAKHGEFDLIICKEISRFSRDLLDSIRYTRELLQNDVGVYFSSDGLCTIDRDAELRLGIMASIAQQEVARLSERVKFGHKKAIENGVVMGNSRIIGYRKENKHLAIDEKEAELVRTVFELFSTGEYSLRQMEEILYNKGFRSLNGNKIMHNTIKSMIQNPKYKGYYCGNKVKIVDYRTKKQKFLDKEDWLMYKDETGEIVPAIVDEELWDKCNAMLDDRLKDFKGNVGGVRKTSPLSGMIICSHCGKPMYHNSYGQGTKLGTRYQWICQIKKKSAKDCPTFPIFEEELYGILENFFFSLSEDIDGYINEYIDIFNSVSHANDIEKEVQSLNKEIERLQKQKQKILDLYTEDLITKADFVSENNKILIRIEECNQKIKTANNERGSQNDIVRRLSEIRKYFKTSFHTQDRHFSKEAIDSMCAALIDKIYVESVNPKEENIIITLRIGVGGGYTVTNNGQSFGHTIKKMIPIVSPFFKRLNYANNRVGYKVYLAI